MEPKTIDEKINVLPYWGSQTPSQRQPLLQVSLDMFLTGIAWYKYNARRKYNFTFSSGCMKKKTGKN